MKLHNVTLQKTDTCLTYVLKRIGFLHTSLDFRDMDDYFDRILYKENKFQLNTGDILLWEKGIHWEWIPWEINERGIVSKNIPVGFHFGVVEGNGYFSDVTRRRGTPPHYPFLRMRELNDLKTSPDWVLKIKTNEENNE